MIAFLILSTILLINQQNSENKAIKVLDARDAVIRQNLKLESNLLRKLRASLRLE